MIGTYVLNSAIRRLTHTLVAFLLLALLAFSVKQLIRSERLWSASHVRGGVVSFILVNHTIYSYDGRERSVSLFLRSHSSGIRSICTFRDRWDSTQRTDSSGNCANRGDNGKRRKNYLKPIFLFALGVFIIGCGFRGIVYGPGNNPGGLFLLMLGGFAVCEYGIALAFDRLLNSLGGIK